MLVGLGVLKNGDLFILFHQIFKENNMLWKLKSPLNDMFEGELKGNYLGGSTEPSLLDAKLSVLEDENKKKEEETKERKKLVIDYWFDQWYLE